MDCVIKSFSEVCVCVVINVRVFPHVPDHGHGEWYTHDKIDMKPMFRQLSNSLLREECVCDCECL